MAAETFDLAAAAAGTTASTSPAAFVPEHAVTGTVDVRVGKHPIAVAVNPKTNKIYVVNNYGNNVTVIDGKANKTTTVPVGPEPFWVAVNTVTNKIYVTNLRGLDAQGNVSTLMEGSVTVIDGATNKTTKVRAELEPIRLAINEKTNKIYVANQGSNDVTVIDGKTNKTATVQLRPDDAASLYDGVLSPQDVRVNSVTNRIFVTGSQSNTVAVIDGTTNKVLSTVLVEGKDPARPTGLTPTGAAVDETRNKVYTANFTSNDVAAIDGNTNEHSNIPLVDVQDPYAIAVNEKTNKIYVANQTSRSITIIDGATKEAVTIGDLPGKPHDVAINERTNKIYFPLFVLYRGADVGDDKQITGLILELDGATNKIAMALAGITPYSVALNPNTNKVYVINQDSNTVTVFSPGSGG